MKCLIPRQNNNDIKLKRKIDRNINFFLIVLTMVLKNLKTIDKEKLSDLNNLNNLNYT